MLFFVSVKFLWFEMAWGEISHFFFFLGGGGSNSAQIINIWGKIFKEGRLDPPRGPFITICCTPGAPLMVWAVVLVVGGQAPLVVVSLNHFTPKRFWGTFWPKHVVRNASRTINRPIKCIWAKKNSVTINMRWVQSYQSTLWVKN